MQQMIEQGAIMMRTYCIASSIECIARGTWSGVVFIPSTTHDVAAAKVIIEEAGGKVTNLDGEEQRYDQPTGGAVISNGLLHDELLALYKQSQQ